MNSAFITFWSTLFLFLTIISLIDVKTKEIPDSINLLFLILGFLEHISFQGRYGFFVSIKGLLVSLIIGFLISSLTDRIGGGDIKAWIVISVFTGIIGIPFYVIGAFLFQAIMYIIRFAIGKMKLNLPFAPSIFMGVIFLFVLQITMVKI